jgi:serine/threonine protein kinase
MPEDSRLLDLVVRFEEERQAGHSISAEQLCRDCPELLSALRERLQALGAVDRVLDTRHADMVTTAGPNDPNKTRILDAEQSAAAHRVGGDYAAAIPGYEILGELGRGGMGVVYKARQLGLKRLVALKMLLAGPQASPSERARFKAEVEAIARVQHPNLVQIFEVGEHEGRPFFAMEYVDGGNLQDKIAAQPQPPARAAELVEVLARAIHVAHQRGVIHRDLKPANILLQRDEGRGTRDAEPTGSASPLAPRPSPLIPKITDFGLAKRLDVSGGPTLTQHVLGTPSYMAPEQATGQSRNVGPTTDVYALGAILYQLLTGRPPFQGETALGIICQVTTDDPVPPRRLQPGVSTDLETICLKCLEKSPRQRYASAAALADDLHRFLAGEPIQARPISWWRRAAKWARRRPAVAGLLAVSGLALLLLLAGGMWFTQRLATELHKTEVAERNLEEALAHQVAAGLDSDLRQLEMVPQAMAALLAERTDWKEEQLEIWMRSLVKKDDRIFGLSVAFEPGQLGGAAGPKDFCLYVHEHADSLRTLQLLPPSYPPPFYRDRDWYKLARLAQRPTWSEPYQAPGADGKPMVTYSVPFYRDGRFTGVATADLSIAYLRKLHDQLQGLYLGPNRSSFVLSPEGTFLYHPDRRYEFPAEMSSLKRLELAPDFEALVSRMRQEQMGRQRATDFLSGRPATFLFTRLASTGWDFVLVHPDTAENGRPPGG